MSAVGHLVREVGSRGLLSLGDQLVTYQCHHHSLFLDQTVVDALGGEGWGVRRQAAFEASHALLASIYAELGIVEATQRLETAADVFATMGHGKLRFEVTAEGGTVRGHGLHFGTGYIAKYAGRVKNRRPIDAFGAGFVSAAATLAFPSDWGTLEADEVGCVARGDDLCVFALTRRPEQPRFGVVVTRPIVEQMALGASFASLRPMPAATAAEVEVGSWLRGRESTPARALAIDGLPIVLMPMSYTNQITYDTVHLIEKRTPELFPLVLTLVREAAQMGAYHLLGSIIETLGKNQPEDAPPLDLDARLEQMLGIARTLGWGSFTAENFVRGKSLILKSPLTHEIAYYATRHGATVRGRLLFQQGIALAMLRLLTVGVGPGREASLLPYTDALKRLPAFDVTETHSPLRGDAVCQVSVGVVG